MHLTKGSEAMDRDGKKDKTNIKLKRRVLWILLTFLILVIIILIIFLIKGCHAEIPEQPDSSDNPIGGVGLVIDPDGESSKPSENISSEEQGVAISGRSSITIPANEKDVKVDFYNPEENKDLYYLTFELRLFNNSKQGYEVLYSSGLVEPGKHIQQITLSRGLEKGVYEAVVHVQPYRMIEDRTLTNNADMKTVLIVK